MASQVPHQSSRNHSRRGAALDLHANKALAKGTNEYANKFDSNQVQPIGSLHAWEGRDESEALWVGKLLCSVSLHLHLVGFDIRLEL